MKMFLLLAVVLASGVATASAQAPGSAAGGRSGPTNHKPVTGDPVTAAPNYPVSTGPKPGQKVDTTPATGPTRASRSSSTAKAARQGSPTAGNNMQSMPKNSAVKPGQKK